MKLIKITLFVVMILIITVSIFSQTKETPLPSTASGGPGWVIYGQEGVNNKNSNAQIPSDVPTYKREESYPPKTLSVEDKRRNEQLRKELEKDRDEFLNDLHEKLRIPPQYLSKYSNLINSGKVNVIRMFPESYCHSGKVVSMQELERCSDKPQVIGAGSLYSFRLNELPNYLYTESIKSYIGQSDIHFVDDSLVVGNNLTQDIIADIGDIQFETLTLKSDALKFIRNWKYADKKSQFDRQNELLAKGIENNGYIFSNKASVKKDTTYILRSIAYHEKFATFWNTDQIVALRIVGKESDGSIIILWKRLKKSNAPMLTM